MAVNNIQTIAGKTVQEYCKKFPDCPDLTLSKKLYKDFPEYFLTIETARSQVRYYRGHIGTSHRKDVKDKSNIKPLTYDTNPFPLPESKIVEDQVFHLPTSIKKVLYLPDAHIPYHVNSAIEAAVEKGRKEEVDCLYLGGDQMDFYQLSFHEKDPRLTNIADELSACKQYFAYLRYKFPKATIYYQPGNHEKRLERYLKVKAPELLDLPEFQLDTFLKVREQDIIYSPHGTKTYFGKLLVEHGDKMKGNGGVSPARTLALNFKRHVMTGHFHRTNEYMTKVYDGDCYVTYSVGCNCELEPKFFPVNNHNHGFAIVEMDGQEFRVSNYKTINGKVF